VAYDDTTNLATGIINSRVANNPMMIGSNHLETNISGLGVQWRSGVATRGSYTVGSDIAAGAGTERRAVDRQPHLRYQPTLVASQDTYTILFNPSLSGVATGLTQLQTAMDMMAIFNHNINTLAEASTFTIRVTMDIADNSAFVTNLQEVARVDISVSAGTVPRDSPILDLILSTSSAGSNAIVLDAEFVRINFEIDPGGAGVFTAVPFVGQCVAGRRNQMSHKSIVGNFDDIPGSAVVADNISKSGTIVRHKFNSGGQVKPILFTPGGVGSNSFSIDDAVELRRLYRDTADATESLVYIENPFVSPAQNTIYCYFQNPELFQSIEGPFKRNTPLTLLEAKPFVAREFAEP